MSHTECMVLSSRGLENRSKNPSNFEKNRFKKVIQFMIFFGHTFSYSLTLRVVAVDPIVTLNVA